MVDPMTMLKLKQFDDSLGNPSKKMASFNENLLQKGLGLVKDAENVARQKLTSFATSTPVNNTTMTTPVTTTPVNTTTTTPVTTSSSSTTLWWVLPMLVLGGVILIGGGFLWSKKQGTEQQQQLEEEPKEPMAPWKKAIAVILFIVMVALFYKLLRKSAPQKSGTTRINGQRMTDFCLANPSSRLCSYKLK